MRSHTALSERRESGPDRSLRAILTKHLIGRPVPTFGKITAAPSLAGPTEGLLSVRTGESLRETRRGVLRYLC